MALQMQRAFNARMLTKMTVYYPTGGSKGYYDDNNIWVDNLYLSKTIRGMIKTGNKFSQFEEGQALRVEDSGERTSDYRTLYITDKYSIEVEDKVSYDGVYFNVLQRSDEATYGFFSVLLEKSKGWKP